MKKQYSLEELTDAMAQAREIIGRAQTLELTISARQAERAALETKIVELKALLPTLEASVAKASQSMQATHLQRMDALATEYANRKEVLERELCEQLAVQDRQQREGIAQEEALCASIARLTAQRLEAAAKLKDVQTALAKIVADASAYKALVG